MLNILSQHSRYSPLLNRMKLFEVSFNHCHNLWRNITLPPTTKEALLKAEAEHERAKMALQSSTREIEVVETVLPRARERYKAMVAGLGKALYTDVAQARQCLKGLMGQIRLKPNSNGYLSAELRYNNENLMNLALDGGPSKVGMVARGGFEPPTFRL